ncbi:MAG: tRNA preQ1(34) S-adenosylmethionine ribosyltransferase-isomerase QueA [Methylobacteriaceae bacterium]|nr:tRNA preQ1(34) S-adenosylmethionine ribosyltransferase-isomerase QueA [Methylobacteriaceae bacterium]
MRVDLFDFELPEALIALRPLEPRDAARLLVVEPARAGGRAVFQDETFRALPGLLRPGDALVFNDTRVIPSRLYALRRRDGGGPGARIELMLHLREDGRTWRAFARPAKRLKPGDKLEFPGAAVTATVAEKGDDGDVRVVFSLAAAVLDGALAGIGEVPLPPYIAGRRPVDERDREDYQTLYARSDGAVAAPTAGLHFTDGLLKALQDKGIETHFLTLHVGAGTFLPVKAEDTEDHRMHAERGMVSEKAAAALNSVRGRGGRIVAVGTTSLRLLESAADENGVLHSFSGKTDIFITPGYRFRAVDALVTNFHLPRSTLFMLVCAFSGYDTMRAAYQHAVDTGYRFYSYGDGSLLFRADRADE